MSVGGTGRYSIASEDPQVSIRLLIISLTVLLAVLQVTTQVTLRLGRAVMVQIIMPRVQLLWH